MLDQDSLTYVHRIWDVPREHLAEATQLDWEGFLAGLAECGSAYDSTNRLHLQGTNRFRYLNSMVKVYDSGASQTISDNTITLVTWNSEAFDTDTLHDTGANTSKLTVALTGKYLIFGTAQWDISTVGVRGWYAYKNGSLLAAVNFVSAEPGGGTGPIVCGTTIATLTASDYIEMKVYQNSGGNLALLTGTEANSNFGLIYLGE